MNNGISYGMNRIRRQKLPKSRTHLWDSLAQWIRMHAILCPALSLSYKSKAGIYSAFVTMVTPYTKFMQIKMGSLYIDLDSFFSSISLMISTEL